MATIHQLPPSPVQAAWQRYSALVRQLRTDPRLIEDEAHLAARKAAYRHFCDTFNAGCAG